MKFIQSSACKGIQADEKIIYHRISDNYYNPEEVRTFEQMKQNPQFDNIKAIKDRGGKVVVRTHMDVISRLPTELEQKLLHIGRHTPMLYVAGINSAEDGTVVFINQRSFIGGLSELSLDLPIECWK